MTNTKTTHSAPRYMLGTLVEGRTYLYTDLGTFQSGLEACEYWRSMPRNGVAYVFEERDCYQSGVCFGLTRKIVATAGAQ